MKASSFLAVGCVAVIVQLSFGFLLPGTCRMGAVKRCRPQGWETSSISPSHSRKGMMVAMKANTDDEGRSSLGSEVDTSAASSDSSSEVSTGEIPPSASAAGDSSTETRTTRRGPAKRRRRKDRTGSSSSSAAADSREKERQEDIIKRDFDRELVLEEFVDRRSRTTQKVEQRQREDDNQERNGEQQTDARDDIGVPANLRYDPTFELPIPSETVLSLSDIANKFEGAIDNNQEDKPLPTLAELGKKAKGSILKKQLEVEEKASKELEPIEDYSLSSGILGEGRPVFGIGLPYLQSCHTVIILVTLLCAFVEFPGFPLTNLPLEFRDFLKQGLLVTYAINTVLAVNSIGEAVKREQSVFFWALKCFCLGGLAHNELLLIKEKKQGAI